MIVNVDEIIELLRNVNGDGIKTSVTYKKDGFMYKVEINVQELYEEDKE